MRPRPNDDLLCAGQRFTEPAGKGMGFAAAGRHPQGRMMVISLGEVISMLSFEPRLRVVGVHIEARCARDGL